MKLIITQSELTGILNTIFFNRIFYMSSHFDVHLMNLAAKKTVCRHLGCWEPVNQEDKVRGTAGVCQDNGNLWNWERVFDGTTRT